MVGTVKKINAEARYLFVHGDDRRDYFVHVSAVLDDSFFELKEGDEVLFDPLQTERGPRAANVVRK
jgi:CspA family cold shock protein